LSTLVSQSSKPLEEIESLDAVVEIEELQLVDPRQEFGLTLPLVVRLEHAARPEAVTFVTEQALESGTGVTKVGVPRENLAVQLDGLFDLTEVMLQHVADPEIEGVDPTGGGRSLVLREQGTLGFEEIDQLAPAVFPAVEAVERLHRPAIPRVGLEKPSDTSESSHWRH
jgi:hypothetical protein